MVPRINRRRPKRASAVIPFGLPLMPHKVIANSQTRVIRIVWPEPPDVHAPYDSPAGLFLTWAAANSWKIRVTGSLTAATVNIEDFIQVGDFSAQVDCGITFGDDPVVEYLDGNSLVLPLYVNPLKAWLDSRTPQPAFSPAAVTVTAAIWTPGVSITIDFSEPVDATLFNVSSAYVNDVPTTNKLWTFNPVFTQPLDNRLVFPLVDAGATFLAGLKWSLNSESYIFGLDGAPVLQILEQPLPYP